jgi:hypothetical protein
MLLQGKKEKKGKKKKDPTADRSIESLFAELVSNGILQPCPHVHVRDFVGSSSFMQATLEKVWHDIGQYHGVVLLQAIQNAQAVA